MSETTKNTPILWDELKRKFMGHEHFPVDTELRVDKFLVDMTEKHYREAVTAPLVAEIARDSGQIKEMFVVIDEQRDEIARLTARVAKDVPIVEIARKLATDELTFQDMRLLKSHLREYDATATATPAPDAASEECDSCHGKGDRNWKVCDVCGVAESTPDAPRDHKITEDRIHQACVAAAEQVPKITLHMVSKNVLDALTTRLEALESHEMLKRENPVALDLERLVLDFRTFRKETRKALVSNAEIFLDWSECVNDSLEKLVDRSVGHDTAIDGLLIGLGVDLSPYGDPPRMNKEQIITALQSRTDGR